MKFKEQCGLFGVSSHPRAAELTFLGLYALQHRGQEGAGIVSSDGVDIYQKKALGLVSDVFNRDDFLRLKGEIAIGHNRYSTTGSAVLPNVQPLLAELKNQPIAVAHNGNLVNASKLRQELINRGSIFQTSMDSEVILHLMAHSSCTEITSMFIDALRKLQGAFSVVLLSKDKILAAKDPWGFRPLCTGKSGRSFFVASETCALDIVGASLLKEIEPGELAILEGSSIDYVRWSGDDSERALCIFEYIYFSRPDSVLYGHCVHEARKEMGRQLAKEHPVEGDVVISVPDSSNAAALGYAEFSGIPPGLGFIRNHYIGRTFIDPSQTVRDLQARIKYNPVKEVLTGKRVVVVDDSIVRGTTSKMLVKLLRDAGAREVHLRIGSGPIVEGCYYGIDTPDSGELIAARLTISELAKYLNADSVEYLSIEGMVRSVPADESQYCLACFNGNYPVKPREKLTKHSFENSRILDI